jgi:hypothetical protein
MSNAMQIPPISQPDSPNQGTQGIVRKVEVCA